MSGLLRSLTDQLLDLLYPPKCAFCQKLTQDGRMLCPACEKTIARTGTDAARRDIPNLALCLSPLYYTGAVRRSLQRGVLQSLCRTDGVVPAGTGRGV